MIRALLVIFTVLCIGLTLVAQEETTEDVIEKDLRPVKNMFEAIWVIDNQTTLVPIKGTFEFDIQHRFGQVNNGFDDFWGLYANSNIRLGFHYVPVERLMLGFGICKSNITWDVNAKYALLRQARLGGSPVSLTYFVNAALDTRDKKFFTRPDELKTVDRLSYFHQLILARKLNENLSMQVAGSISHFNQVLGFENPENGKEEGKWNNNHAAVSVIAKYKIGEWINLIGNFDQPVTQHNDDSVQPKPNVSFGIEMTSSSHQFQLFVGNFYDINPQRNNMFNQNGFGSQQVLIGFNLSRLWNF
jgi:hypothetical protein